MPNEKHVTERGETAATVTEYERIYKWLVNQKYIAIRNEHKHALADDQRKVDAGLFRPLSQG